MVRISTPEEQGAIPLTPQGRTGRIFVNVLISHLLMVVLPVALALWSEHWVERMEPLSVNLVDVPMSGVRTGPAPSRVADTLDSRPALPEPALPKNMTPPPEPVAELPVLPRLKPVTEPAVVPPSPRPASRTEPKIVLPSPPVERVVAPSPTRTAAAGRNLADDRRLSNAKSGGGAITDLNVPLGKADVAQTFAETFSNTPPGGTDKMSQYSAKLTMFLKAQWQNFVPSRADLGSSRPTVQILLSISGTGQVLEAKIVRPSGVAAMDAAAARFLANQKQLPAPPEGKTWRHDNIELDTEM